MEIIDFNNLPNGLLGITVKVQEKVDIKSIVQLEDRSYIGEILPQVEHRLMINLCWQDTRFAGCINAT